MEVKRRERCARAWRMVLMRPCRETDRTLKIVVTCCVALFFLSPGFSWMLPADSKMHMGGNVMLERSVKMAEVARSETRGRILDEVPVIKVERERVEDDLTSDYSTPTHNHNPGDGDESPDPPTSSGTSRFRASQQFARYTAQYGHRHLRGE